MKRILFCLLLTACSVNKNVVANRPPEFPHVSMKLGRTFGVLDPLVSLSVFFWPETRGGAPLTLSERQDIIAAVNQKGTLLDRLTDQQEAALNSVCGIKHQMFEYQCWKWSAEAVDAENTCEMPWVGEWLPNSSDAMLKECQNLQARGQQAELVPDQLVPQKMKLQQDLIQLLETEPGQSNFMFADAGNSKIEMEPGENGDVQFRIKLAFTKPAIIYDSQPDGERGLIDHVEYNANLHTLKFQMHEKVDGDETGGLFQMVASRVIDTNGVSVVRFSGEMTYTHPSGLKRSVRFKWDGHFQD